VAAKYVLAVIACGFLIAGAFRVTTPAFRLQGRIWLFVGVIFGAVSTWLFLKA
jgi:hypothetical protein